MKANIGRILDEWSEKKLLNGKSFDDFFKLDGISYWWFLRKYYVPHVLPTPINSLKELINGQPLTLKKRFKASSASAIIPRYLHLRELRKVKDSQNHFFKKSNQEEKEGEKEIREKHSGKILFLSYSNHLKENNTFRIQGVFDQIKQKNKFEPMILYADPMSGNGLAKIRDKYNIYQYVDDNIKKKAHKVASVLAKRWKEISEKNKIRMLTIDDLNYYDYLKYSLNMFMSYHFIYLNVLYYETCRKIIEQEKVKAVVVTGISSIFERCLLAAAKDIPSIMIQHGLGGGSVGEISGKIGNLFDTNFAIFSNHFIDVYQKAGVNKEYLKVTGPLIFDEIAKYRDQKETKGEKLKGKEDSNQIKEILIVTEPFVERNFSSKEKYFNYIYFLLESLKKLPNININLKLHPAEIYLNNYQQIIDKLRMENVKITAHKPKVLYELLSQTDLLIEFGSTVALEAMILDIPIVTTDFHPIVYGNYVVIKEMQATTSFDHKQDISLVVKQILEKDTLKSARNNAVKKFCSIIDGKASHRVAKELYKVIN
jgi:disulfide oxidoreductase YuzD